MEIKTQLSNKIMKNILESCPRNKKIMSIKKY